MRGDENLETIMEVMKFISIKKTQVLTMIWIEHLHNIVEILETNGIQISYGWRNSL